MDEFVTRFVREVTISSSLFLEIFFALLIFMVIAVIVYWLYTRKKIHELTHQIPASVLKNYLDSIIQNSTSLKSSLFRGGGLEIGEGIPSVLPVGQFGSGASLEVASDQSAELSRKDAEIISLNRRLQDKSGMILDLEKRIAELESLASESGGESELIVKYQKEIEDLKAQLAVAPVSSGADTSQIEAQLSDVTKERDEFKERLLEYEIIEEDLANLKRIQQENEQLKAKISELESGSAPAPVAEVAAAEPVAEPAPEPTTEPEVAEEEEDLEAAMAAAIANPDPEPEAEPEPGPKAAPAVEAAAAADIPEEEGEQKSAEELLQEFERMLD